MCLIIRFVEEHVREWVFPNKFPLCENPKKREKNLHFIMYNLLAACLTTHEKYLSSTYYVIEKDMLIELTFKKTISLSISNLRCIVC